MILGRTYQYYLDESGEAVSASDRQEHEHLRGDVHPDHVRTVAPDEVRWIDERPMHPNANFELEEIVEKMSKSKGNVINPDDVIAEYGADTLRLYEMFMGPLEQAKPWDQRSVNGAYRFVTRIWRLVAEEQGEGLNEEVLFRDDTLSDEEVRKELHRCIKRVTEETEEMRFNTAIAAMMEYVNFLYKQERLPRRRSLPSSSCSLPMLHTSPRRSGTGWGMRAR